MLALSTQTCPPKRQSIGKQFWSSPSPLVVMLGACAVISESTTSGSVVLFSFFSLGELSGKAVHLPKLSIPGQGFLPPRF